MYLFDKKLRQLMLDAIERIEIYIRTVIAHEIGRLDPLAYEKEKIHKSKILEDREKGGVVAIRLFCNSCTTLWMEECFS